MAAKTKNKPTAQYAAVVLLRRSNAASAVPSGRRKTRTQAKRAWKQEVA